MMNAIMRRISYKILLFFLRGLVAGKRALVWCARIAAFVFGKGAALYRLTLGIWAYKAIFSVRKSLGYWAAPYGSWLTEHLSRRAVLQLVACVIFLFLMLPESHLYGRDDTKIPGRETILYKIVGPGDQDFTTELEEIGVEARAGAKDARSWREGAAEAEAPAASGARPFLSDEGIVGTSRGGTALAKPTIIPGAVLPGVISSARTEVVYYEVHPGDVIGEIAKRYGVSAASILWANSLSARSYIRPGDKLKVPPVSGVLHLVKKGDTVRKIAQLYKAKEEDIIAFNKLRPGGTDIVVGEELVVPQGLKATPVSAPAPLRGVLANIAAPPPSVEAPAGSGYIWPAAVRRITQYFGLRHTGIDIGGPLGTAIYAARLGVVRTAQCGWNGGYGCFIVIDHGGGAQTAYGHASQLYVEVGQEVQQGQTIAGMGSTGRSTGSHVHFEVRVRGVRQNPLRYVR